MKTIYLSNCNIKSAEYQILFDTKTTLTKLYIFNSSIDQNLLTNLRSNLLVCKEMFIHSLCDINIEEILRHFTESCSTVLVTKNEMFGCNPTTKQIALALQLEKSINILKLLHCQGSFDCFDQIITMLTTTQNSWTELDFMNCELAEIDYDILQTYLKINKQNATIKKLKVSSKQLTELLVPKFITTIVKWKVQQIIFYDISHTIYECFITKFTTTISIDQGEVFLSVTYNSNKDIYFCNYSWNKITKLLERNSGAALYIVNCYYSSQPENLNIIILSHISKLHIVNSSLHEDTMVNILETFVERRLEISICNTSNHIDDQALYNFITSKKLLYQSRVNFVAVMKNFMCGYNTTKDQLQILQSQKLNDLEHAIVTLVSDTKQTHEKQVFVFQNKQLTALHFVGKDSETKFFTTLVGMPKRISTLKYFGIEKYTITSEVAIDIANILSHNKGLEQLYLNSKLQITDLLKIMQVLAKFINLKVLEIGNITDQITEYLTLIISDNARLQYFSITNGDLTTTNVIKISKAIQNTSNLQKLTITGNNNGATNIIAANNSKTQKLNDLEDNMQTMCIKISAKRSQNIPTLANLHTGAFSCNTELHGFDANFRTKDAIAIIKAAVIYNNFLLQEFDISKSNLQSTAGIKIIKALQTISTLTKLYISNNTITEETADNITTVICNNTQLQEFGVGKNNLQSTGAIKIAKALQNISTLTKLYINNNHITDLAADDIAAVFSCNTQLQEVDISRNSFQSTGAIKIAKALQNISTLTKLYLNNNHITDLAADDIAIVLSRNTQLQELDISENNFQTTGAKTITKALQSGYILKKLYISNNNITAEAADDIAAVIYSNTQLQEVDVSRNSFQSTGAIKIAKALQNISTLTKLYLNNNHITDLAADDIATAVSCNTQIQELDISENNFQTTGAKTITIALQSGYLLRKLYISNNNITTEAADDIAAVICRSTQLQEVDVSRNSFQSTGAIKILKAVQISTVTKLHINSIHFTNDAAADIAAAVSHNTHLQELDISNNQIEANGIMKIAKALQSNATLKKLYMSGIRITDKAADIVATALSFNVQLQELDISKNMLLTNGIKPISKVLQGIVTLTKLCINENSISDDAADDIAAVIHSNTQLQEFNVSKNTFEVLGTMTIATALQSVSKLTKLYINDNNITSEAADNIAAVICYNTQLQEFDISENKLQATGVIVIAKALQSITTLKKLCISNNIYIGKNAYMEGTLSDIENITEKAAYSFAEAVSHNVKLQEIDFSKNYFPTTGIVRIMQVLQSIFTINKLYVINNNIIEETADHIGAALAFNTQLQELDISRNNLQTQGTIKIAKALQGIFTLKILRISNNNIADDAADDIAAALSHSYQLEVFSINGNYIGAPGMIKIARALQQISTLQRLYINKNRITDEAADDIVAVSFHNTQLRELFIHSNLFTYTKIVELKDRCHKLNCNLFILYI